MAPHRAMGRAPCVTQRSRTIAMKRSTSATPRAFVTGLAKVFPAVPHRLCKIHFLRALAKDVHAADQHIKVAMRRKVRGLRAIEQAAAPPPTVVASTVDAVSPAPDAGAASTDPPVAPPVATTVPPHAALVLDYCTTVRGILVGEQGDPLHPTGERMASALDEVRDSLDRCVAREKGGPPTRC
jgi:hypothetical protein